MEQFLYPTLTAFFAALITWFFSRKTTEIENEIKSLKTEDEKKKKKKEIYEKLVEKLVKEYKI